MRYRPPVTSSMSTGAQRLSVALAGAAVLWLALPGWAAAGVHSYELHVEGTACLFRAFGLERTLGRLDGVRHVEVEPATGAIHVTLGPDATIMPEELAEPIEDAGMRLVSVSVVARGTVRGSAEGGRLIVGGSRAFVLLEGPATDELRPLLADGHRALELRGPLTRHGDGWGMAVEAVAEPEQPEEGED